MAFRFGCDATECFLIYWFHQKSKNLFGFYFFKNKLQKIIKLIIFLFYSYILR